MEITVWLAGFVAFILGSFHLSLWAIFRARFHLWLSVGWLSNCLYLYLEKQSMADLDPAVPFVTGTTLLIFFLLAEAEIGAHTYQRALLLYAGGISLSCLLLVMGGRHFWSEAIGGSIFSSLVYVQLGASIYRLDLPGLRNIFLGSKAELLYQADTAENNGRNESFLPVDALLRGMQKRAFLLASTGKQVSAGAFFLFGLLQLTYPLRPFIIQASEPLWSSLFYIGMSLKFMTGIGFVTLLASHTKLVEVLARRADLSADLAKITASVEHDMRGPLGEIGTVIDALERKAKDDHPQYGNFLRSQASYLTYIQAKATAVMEMIVAMREPPEEFEKTKRSFSIGEPMKRAIESAKILHPEPLPTFRMKAFNPSYKIYGNAFRLSQVLLNLINNAIEATLEVNPEGRPPVYVGSSMKNGEVEISIRDEGVGIDPVLLRTVTEAGVTTKLGADSATNSNRGMGLYVAKRIVEMHGGRLELESAPSEGTIATVTLSQGM